MNDALNRTMQPSMMSPIKDMHASAAERRLKAN